MLIVLFVYYLVQSAYIDASPVPSTDNRLLVGNRCTDLTHCRTIWSIVWSCLVTIFSCTWVAVHPNIPCPKKREANTHLEIITLAYATMNFVIYIFWWNKPLNVNRPARVFRKSKPRETQTQARKLILEAWKLTWEATVNGLRTILCFIVGKQDADVNLSHKDRVPMFWANSAGEQEIADVIVLGVGVCFGAIHCVAWNFSFPTHTEVLIWRISSVTITAVPMFIPLMLLLGTLVNKTDFTVTDVISTFLAGTLYILARVVTLVLAFTSLRDLQPGVYETVHWTTFIPHV